MPQNAFFSMHRWSSGQLKNDANTTVVAFVLLRNCRFSFHCYTQHEAAPTQKSAPKWQLWRFVTSYTERFHLCKPALLNCPVRKMPWSLLWYFDSDPGSRTQELEEMMKTVCLLGCALLRFLCLVDYIWILDIIYTENVLVSQVFLDIDPFLSIQEFEEATISVCLLSAFIVFFFWLCLFSQATVTEIILWWVRWSLVVLTSPLPHPLLFCAGPQCCIQPWTSCCLLLSSSGCSVDQQTCFRSLSVCLYGYVCVLACVCVCVCACVCVCVHRYVSTSGVPTSTALTPPPPPPPLMTYLFCSWPVPYHGWGALSRVGRAQETTVGFIDNLPDEKSRVCTVLFSA